MSSMGEVIYRVGIIFPFISPSQTSNALIWRYIQKHKAFTLRKKHSCCGLRPSFKLLFFACIGCRIVELKRAQKTIYSLQLKKKKVWRTHIIILCEILHTVEHEIFATWKFLRIWLFGQFWHLIHSTPLGYPVAKFAKISCTQTFHVIQYFYPLLDKSFWYCNAIGITLVGTAVSGF